MAREITRSEAWELLQKYNQEPFHLQHGRTVEAVMGWYADKLGYGAEKDFWKLVGLLHDLDFEKWPEQHCEKGLTFIKCDAIYVRHDIGTAALIQKRIDHMKEIRGQ